MKQEQYNKLDDDLRSERKRFANVVIKKARNAGLNPKNLVHRLAIQALANVDYEIVLTLLIEVEKKK